MPGAITDLGDTLKLLYPDLAVEAMLNEEQVVRPLLSSKIPAGATVNEGYELRFAAYMKKRQNVAQVADNKIAPYMKDGLDKQLALKPTLFMTGFEVGYMASKAVKSSKSAFGGSVIQRAVKDAVPELGKFMEQSYAATNLGKRAMVDSSTATTITLQKPLQASLLKENHLISVRQAADTTTAQNTLDGVIISEINYDTGVITPLTYAGAAPTCSNAVSGDHIYIVSNGAALASGAIQVVAGVFSNSLRMLIDDGTVSDDLHGLSRATYGKLKCQVNDNGGILRDIDESIINRLAAKIGERSGKKPQSIFCGYGIAEKFAEKVAPARRYPVSGNTTQSYTTGYDTKDLLHVFPGGSLKFDVSHDACPRELMLINWETLFLHKPLAPTWVDDDGGMLHMIPQTGRMQMGFQAFMAAIENIGCYRPDANGIIRDLVDAKLGDTAGA